MIDFAEVGFELYKTEFRVEQLFQNKQNITASKNKEAKIKIKHKHLKCILTYFCNWLVFKQFSDSVADYEIEMDNDE